MTKEEASAILAGMVSQVSTDLTACQKFADEHGLQFFFEHPDSDFCDQYKSKALQQEQLRRYYKLDDPADKADFDSIEGSWQSSSINC